MTEPDNLIYKERRCKHAFKRHGAGYQRRGKHEQRRWVHRLPTMNHAPTSGRLQRTDRSVRR